ncbi:MAG: hypothetical protein BMS9Abin34_071 [Patescibacteria group bacterium]|nr:MAG: hypothetical protein BMS9Abin34_071 [Patescibacteria group bacterium]
MRFFFGRRKRRPLRHPVRIFTPGSSRRPSFFAPALIIFLTVLSGFLFLRSDIFQIKALEFEFEEIADEALVRQRIMEEVLARSIFFLNPSAVEIKIKDIFPTIRSVQLEKKWPDRLTVAVAVRVPLAIVEDGSGSRFLIDGEGVLFREAGGEKLPVIKLADDFEGVVGLEIDKQGVAGYLDTLNLAAEKGLKPQAIYLRSTSIELRLKGTVIWLDAEGDIPSQMDLLTELLKRYKLSGRTPKTVDLRFARPVVRL